MITKTLKLEEISSRTWKEVLFEIVSDNQSIRVKLPDGKDVKIEPAEVKDKSYKPYINSNEDGIPYIKGTNMKVIELILDKIAYGWSPEELQLNFPHLSMAKILAALMYYEEHKEQLNVDIEKRIEHIQNIEKDIKAHMSSKLKIKLKRKGML